MYKNRNKIALFILLKLEKIINGTIGEWINWKQYLVIIYMRLKKISIYSLKTTRN
jgi:hypothetical protein